MFCIYQQENTGVGTFLQIKPLAEVLRFYSKETPAHTKDVFRTHLNIYNGTFCGNTEEIVNG